ncbi:MAG: sugar phosphate isomerase/epimerase [Verrucomicrobiales bacterium]|nr:sugar phosphate isomerase/epimerase [Verrucomicrobiales bacterium]
MILTGIADEAGDSIDSQIAATKALGWEHIEARFLSVGNFEKGSIHEIPEEAFNLAVDALNEAEIKVCGIGSTIGNWAHPITDPFDITEGEVERCITRMKVLGTSIVRVMSYSILEEENENDHENQLFEERIKRLKNIITRFEDNGITPVHENCMNYGGMSISHALKLQNEIPKMKWVFDTGNPVFNADRSTPRPYPRQDAWSFYQAIKENIVHVHIKDGIWDNLKNECTFTMPGEGDGKVKEILADLKKTNYEGFISIEPHIASVFHEEDKEDLDQETKEKNQLDTYIEYGKRLEEIISKIAI